MLTNHIKMPKEIKCLVIILIEIMKLILSHEILNISKYIFISLIYKNILKYIKINIVICFNNFKFLIILYYKSFSYYFFIFTNI